MVIAFTCPNADGDRVCLPDRSRSDPSRSRRLPASYLINTSPAIASESPTPPRSSTAASTSARPLISVVRSRPQTSYGRQYLRRFAFTCHQLLSALVHRLGITVIQITVANKTNEIGAVLGLLN